MFSLVSRLGITCLLVITATMPFPAHGSEAVRLASAPALSPDGQSLAISWRGDIWTVSTNGGSLKRITSHSGRDYYPEYS
ncbi:MAG: hypothetical protein GY888_14550, partial [Planctomycetaceae bacterium]|nr:hypothetical protein [Planctomycetaceae bacterium]